ncbi:hypothetical protein C8R42DRAFT_726281 [Lentinula raphanica]|nr:hypothetical protein C8R42DRAFT_726281 [Lentinula raphanica]
MRCITLLLFGLFSATYAAPTSSPVAGPGHGHTAPHEGGPGPQAGSGCQRTVHTNDDTSVTPDNLFYEVADPTFSDQQWTEKLLLEKGFEKDMQQWLEDFLEERVFKTYLGISARPLEGTYDNFYKRHPRNTKFRIRTPQGAFVAVIPFPCSWEPHFEGQVTSRTPLDSHLSAKIPCTVEIDFESHWGWAIIAFIADDKPQARRAFGQIPMIWIALAPKDKTFLERCDKLVHGRTSVRFEDLPTHAPDPPLFSVFSDRTYILPSKYY